MPKPELRVVDVPANLQIFVKDRRLHINSDLDNKYRKALLRSASLDGGSKAKWHIALALENGPDKIDVADNIKYFGDGLSEKLALTAQIVDGLEISVPGFKKWLTLTGFGNDRRMIMGFIAWAEYKNGKGRVSVEFKH